MSPEQINVTLRALGLGVSQPAPDRTPGLSQGPDRLAPAAAAWDAVAKRLNAESGMPVPARTEIR